MKKYNFLHVMIFLTLFIGHYSFIYIYVFCIYKMKSFSFSTINNIKVVLFVIVAIILAIIMNVILSFDRMQLSSV